MSAVMAELYVVPIKDVETPFDDNVNQTKTGFWVFLFFFYCSPYLKHVLYRKYQKQHFMTSHY